MQLFSLCVAYACPYHNPSMVHTGTVETGIHQWRAHFSSGHRRWAFTLWSQLEHLPSEVSYDTELQSGQDPGEDDENQMNFPETASDSLCINSVFVQIHRYISCLGGCSQTIPQVKPDVEVLGWLRYTWSVVVRPVGRTAKYSKTTLEAAYGWEINIQFSGNRSDGHSWSQHTNCTLPENMRHLVALCCDKTVHFRVAFYCPQHKVHLCIDHAIKSAYCHTTPVRWMDYLGKGEMRERESSEE
jgi:hypothetical protein